MRYVVYNLDLPYPASSLALVMVPPGMAQHPEQFGIAAEVVAQGSHPLEAVMGLLRLCTTKELTDFRLSTLPNVIRVVGREERIARRLVEQADRQTAPTTVISTSDIQRECDAAIAEEKAEQWSEDHGEGRR